MSDIMFHKCRTNDAEKLCELIQNELGYTEITADEVRKSIEKMSDDYFTIVAEDNGVICGYVSAVREIGLEIGEYCRVLGLAVKKEYRG